MKEAMNKTMNKKQYLQPQLHAVNINIENNLLSGSVSKVNSNAGMQYGGAGGGKVARGREASDWFDEE